MLKRRVDQNSSKVIHKTDKVLRKQFLHVFTMNSGAASFESWGVLYFSHAVSAFLLKFC